MTTPPPVHGVTAVTADRPPADDTGAVQDITDRADLDALLRAFYARAYADDLIGFVFTDVTHMDLELHLPVIVDFWETVLFRTGVYQRNALQPHVNIHAMSPLRPEQFERWLHLWRTTVDERHAGERAERAKVQAERVAGSMQRRLAGQSGSEHVTIRRSAPG
jgi:hemoglobin